MMVPWWCCCGGVQGCATCPEFPSSVTVCATCPNGFDPRGVACRSRSKNGTSFQPAASLVIRTVADLVVEGRSGANTILTSRPIAFDRTTTISAGSLSTDTVCRCTGGSTSLNMWEQQFGTYVEGGVTRPYFWRERGFFRFNAVDSNWFACTGQPSQRWCDQRGSDLNNTIGSYTVSQFNQSMPGGPIHENRKAWWSEAGGSAAVSLAVSTANGYTLSGTASTSGSEGFRGDCPCDSTETTTFDLRWQRDALNFFDLSGTVTRTLEWHCLTACGGFRGDVPLDPNVAKTLEMQARGGGCAGCGP